MQCVTSTQSGALYISNDSAVCDYVLITQAELQSLQLNGVIDTLNTLFAFDLADFGLITTAGLTAFVTAHAVGRIVRTMGKS
ncbi:hypothetical protein [Pseudoalteromonas luteoviolacea]|uniref:hypothetical protein n=1 Tax=Pseudoalteromonas luteoviolacea TaxID=43657 RepID=UPI0007B0461A|nr:hypothetical protein [Pseudoalteromonas luteoviolacea]KZN58416.1 hypothetical protein N474_25540 [Pseudoalteromonas luteoviolacea CPMOR-2]TQF71128.1 hypothetical protein FLM44_08575 [Pseudoalteromonas luteoviolacea]